MPKLYNCTNCQKIIRKAPVYKVLENGEFLGLVLCSWRCMEQHAAYEADKEEEAEDEQPS